MGILAWTTLLPLLGAILVVLVPKEEEAIHRGIGFATALATFLVSLFMFRDFDFSKAGFQLEVNHVWVASLGINFHLGVDGISLWLVLLTTLMIPVTLFFPHSIGLRNIRVREFTVAMLLMETGMIGAFLAVDLFVFYVFWELMLIPMYFVIGIWGGERRFYAAIKFVIYTLIGSLLMLAAILYLYAQGKALTGSWTFDYQTYASMLMPELPQELCFGAFALAFLIKVPLFPLHTWLPDAHVEAPTGGSVILAAVMLKFGTYGLLRFAIPFFPLAAWELAPLITILAVIGIIYGALVAYVQPDVKKLVAYSSVSHLGFVVLGLFALNPQGIQGGLFQMLAHGISTGGLFLAVGLLYDRRHTRRLDDFGGLWKRMPVFGAFFLIIVLASGGLPGLCGFIGEFLVLLGTFTAERAWLAASLPQGRVFPYAMLMGVLAASAVILTALYLLTMYQKIMFGPLDKPENRDPKLKDIHGREVWVFGTIAVFAFLLGIYPKPILQSSEPAVKALIASYDDRLRESYRDPDAPPRFYPAPPPSAEKKAPPPSPTPAPAPGATP